MTNWVIGNWKMNPDYQQAKDLISGLQQEFKTMPSNAKVGVCPPDIWLVSATDAFKGVVATGSQDNTDVENGAHTGDSSASMVASSGATLAIVGHSERRDGYQESDELIAKKMQTANKHGLTPVLCVGESLAERKAGTHIATVETQINNVIKNTSADLLANSIIAYEPIWAIGTGLTPTSDDIAAMHGAIISLLSKHMDNIPSILYGGSVKPNNAVELAKIEGVSGFLVGGASLDAAGFMAIARSFDN